MADTDPRLVRLVTRHFADLQGLRLAASAPVYLVASWAWLATGRELAVFVWGGAALLVAGVMQHVLGRFYARFGRVQSSGRGRRGNFIPYWFGGMMVLLLRVQEHTMPGAPSLFWLLVSVYPLWLAADGWPLRWWHVGTFASMVYVAFGRSTYPDPPAFAWMAPRMWAFSATLVVTGILDHVLLLRIFRQTRDDAAEESAS
jgi:hypothetical protein